MAKKNRVHEEVWRRLCGEVMPVLKSWGFVEHPLWNEPGWDRYNQAYTFYLMHKDVRDGLLEAECRYTPRLQKIWLKITRYSNSGNYESLTDFDVGADDWVQRRFNDQWVEWELQRGSFRNIFRRSSFKIKFRRDAPEQNNVDSEMQLLLAGLPHLQRAVFSGSKSKYVDTDSQEARQREEARPKIFGKSLVEWSGEIMGICLTVAVFAALFTGVAWVLKLLLSPN